MEQHHKNLPTMLLFKLIQHYRWLPKIFPIIPKLIIQEMEGQEEMEVQEEILVLEEIQVQPKQQLLL